MTLVQTGRRWEINTREDYLNAMHVLEENEFCAQMSDDYYCWQNEMREVARQRAQVRAMAREKGINIS